MLVSYSKHFIFIHNYKVAGSSIKAVLSRFENQNIFQEISKKLFKKYGVLINLPYYKFRYFPDHLTAAQIRNRLPDLVYDRFFTFSFVRNPWDWQVSLYFYMRQNASHFQHQIVKDMDFEEYIQWRIKEDLHLQREFIMDKHGRILVDFIGKYENLKEDFSKVCKRIEVEAKLPHLNPSQNKDYRTYYTPKTKGMVETAFRDDIEYFNYQFDK